MLIDAQKTKLPNGLRVVTANMPNVESVSIGIWLGVGSRHETGRLSGISHFIEHLLFKGTDNMSALEISRSIEGCGGYINAFTQEEATCYYARAACNHTWKILGILCDLIMHPRLDESDVAKERDIIIEEIMMYRDNPEHLVQESLDGIMWKNHQLGMPVTGTPETLRRIRRDDIVRFKNGKYTARNTVFVFAGKICHDEAVARVERLMNGYPVRRGSRSIPVSRHAGQDRLILKSKEVEQSQLAAGFRTFGMFDRRRYALKVLSVILGENMSSRLFQVVREKYGLAYSVHSGVQLFSDTGCIVICAGLDRNRRYKGLELIAREISRLKRTPVKQGELTRAREYVVGHIRLSLESPTGQMMWTGSNMLNYGRPVEPEEVIDAVYGVGADDIQALARTVFRPRAASLALLSHDLKTRDREHAGSVLSGI